MLRTITPSEMKRIENRVMTNTSITGEALMQKAAACVADEVRKLRRNRGGVVVCVCGTGNNGGDGMAAMRMLAQADASFCGVCWLLPGQLSADARRELNRLEKEAGSRVAVRVLKEGETFSFPSGTDCIVDALFGTGLSRPLKGLAADVCRVINACNAPVVAVDIPSGLNGETGEAADETVCADVTVTFHRPKPGLYLRQGPDYAGNVIVADIGLRTPEASALDDAQGMEVLEKKDLARLLPARKRVSHKGNYGRVLLFAGSRGMAGAAAISATAALRTGAGLVMVACPECIVDIVQVLCPCATCLPLPEDLDEAWEALEPALEKADAIGAGCGLGMSGWARKLIERLADWLEEHGIPAVLDADALNHFSMKLPRKLGAHTFITPHPMEARRLLHATIDNVLADTLGAAEKLRKTYGVSVVLKGSCSILYAGDGTAINPFGTLAMAKGGSGDALTGILTALLAGRAAQTYAMNDLEVMQTACALHGLAGEMAARRMGERGMLATDLCACLGLIHAEAVQEEPELRPFRQNVTVVVEHPAGSRDTNDRHKMYPLNCGYVQQELEEKNEWQDACLLGCREPLEWFEGDVCACVTAGGRRVWAIAAAGELFTREDVDRELSFLGEITDIQMF